MQESKWQNQSSIMKREAVHIICGLVTSGVDKLRVLFWAWCISIWPWMWHIIVGSRQLLQATTLNFKVRRLVAAKRKDMVVNDALCVMQQATNTFRLCWEILFRQTLAFHCSWQFCTVDNCTQSSTFTSDSSSEFGGQTTCSSFKGRHGPGQWCAVKIEMVQPKLFKAKEKSSFNTMDTISTYMYCSNLCRGKANLAFKRFNCKIYQSVKEYLKLCLTDWWLRKQGIAFPKAHISTKFEIGTGSGKWLLVASQVIENLIDWSVTDM